MRHSHPSRRRQRGLTLIEVGFAIIIGAALIALALGAYEVLFGSTNDSAEAQTVLTVIGSVQGLKNAGTYGASGTNLVPSLLAANLIPTEWSVNAGTINNTAGGSVQVVSNGSTASLTTGGYAQHTCVQVAEKVSGTNTVVTSINGGTAITGPVDAPTASTQCKTGNANSLQFQTLN